MIITGQTMKFEFDTLKYAKLLISKGVKSNDSEALSESLTAINMRNIYSKAELDAMVPQTVTDVLTQFRRESDLRHAEFKERLEADRQQFAADQLRHEADFQRYQLEQRSGRRWLAGLIITVGIALGGYLSALMHLLAHSH